MNKITKTFFHVDGDAFFASCEQATSIALRDKPIIIGYERGAATAMSYQAKALGVKRGMPLREIYKQFPDILPVSSDYKKYALFSLRFKNLIERHYTWKIDKTSIDECYVDVTGLDVSRGTDFVTLAEEMKDMLYEKLGITFSIGIGHTATLAKMGSSMNKPYGVTDTRMESIQQKIHNGDIEHVPGIGYRMAIRMRDMGIYTVYHFIEQPLAVYEKVLAKPYKMLWHELQGDPVQTLQYSHDPPKSISKIHAFMNPTNDKEFLLAELSRHCEVVTEKLRRCKRVSYKVGCGLKTFDRMYRSREVASTNPMNTPEEVFGIVQKLFLEIYDPRIRYRATYVVIYDLRDISGQEELFPDIKKHTHKQVAALVDELHSLYGRNLITRASSQANARDANIKNATPLIYSADMRRVLSIPYCGHCT